MVGSFVPLFLALCVALAGNCVAGVEIDVAKADRVTFPHQEKEVSFKQYSGYLDVLPDRHIHYVFVESQGNPTKDPVVFWTNGGPGCSGMLGFLAEMGPWRPHKDAATGQLQLKENPYSWNRLANMVFLEQPVGVGFSRADGPLEDIDFGDLLASIDNTRVVRKFFEKFPSFRRNDFYLASESYGGHYIPQWALRVLADDVLSNRFRGVIVGNPYVNLGSMFAGGIVALWGMQLIPLPLWEEAVKHGCTDFGLNRNEDTLPAICYAVYQHLFNLNRNVNPYALNYPVCPGFSLADSPLSQQGALQRRVKTALGARLPQQLLQEQLQQPAKASALMPPRRKAYRDNSNEPGFDYEPCTESWLIEYLNLREVQEAMHVLPEGINATGTVSWDHCSDYVNTNWKEEDFATDTVPLYSQLVNQGIKVLIMSGDTDGVCSTHSTQDWVFRIPNTTVKHRWAEWSILQDDEVWQTAGYLSKFTGGLSFSTVRNAGHEVPLYRPAEAYHLFKQYLNGTEIFESDLAHFDTSDVYYGITTLPIELRFSMHSPSVHIDEFLQDGNQNMLAFVARAVRHCLERVGIAVHYTHIESVIDAADAGSRRQLSRETTRSLVMALRVDAEVSFDMADIALEGYQDSRQRQGSSERAQRLAAVSSAVISALGLPSSIASSDVASGVLGEREANGEARSLASIQERKHQRIVDDNLKLKALIVKETATSVLNSAIESGTMSDFLEAALLSECSLPHPRVTADIQMADMSVDVSSYTVVPSAEKPKLIEWDAFYSIVGFPDVTAAPTRTPALLGDESVPIFIFTESSWVVIVLAAALSGSLASVVGFVLYKRNTRAVQYYPVHDDAGSADEEEGGDLEMTAASSASPQQEGASY